MGYTIENKQDAVIESVLLKTESAFTPSKAADQVVSAQASNQSSTEVYFQIED